MSVYKRILKSGYSWRAVIRIKGHPTVSETFERKQEAEDWERTTKQQIKSGKYKFLRPEQTRTLAELLDRYIQEFVQDQHRSPKDTIRHLTYFNSKLGAYALSYLTRDLLSDERKILLATPTNKNKTRTAATVNRYLSSLSGALRYAQKYLGWISVNPCENLIKLKEKPKTRRTLSPIEEKQLLLACKSSPSPYLYCITLIAITTGARKGEILSLTWDCIDFTNNIAYIKDSKNGCPRKIALVLSVIKELKALNTKRNMIKPLVFSSKTTFGKIDIKKAWKKALSQANINNFVFHSIRHHFSTFGGELGASGIQLRAQLGHSSSRMTDHYSHLEAESTRFIGEALESRLNLPILENNND